MRFGKYRVTGGFVLLWALLFFFDSGGWTYRVAVAAAVHELGHWTVMRLFGKRMESLDFAVTGLRMDMSPLPMISYPAEILVSLAGPLSGAAFAVLAGGVLRDGSLAAVSLALTAVNLLPAPTLDGGRALSLLALWLAGERAARAVRITGSALCLCALLAVGIWVAVATGGRNITILCVAVLPAQSLIRLITRKLHF